MRTASPGPGMAGGQKPWRCEVAPTARTSSLKTRGTLDQLNFMPSGRRDVVMALDGADGPRTDTIDQVGIERPLRRNRIPRSGALS